MDGVWIKVDGEWVKATTGSQAEIEAHTNDTENPHKVTKEQIGLGDVKNVEQASKSELELHKKSTGHITEIERDQWNKKETPEGAQEKADEAFEKASGHMEEVLELYETKESAVSRLDEAKEYTDEAVEGIDLSEVEGQIKSHSEVIATDEALGHVKIGEGIEVGEDGTISVEEIDVSSLAGKEELREHSEKLANDKEAGHVTLSDSENGYDSSHGIALAPKALSEHSKRVGGSGAHGHVKLSDSADASRDSDSGWAASPKAVAEGLDEAKNYTNEEIAKIPDVKDTVKTVNDHKRMIKVSTYYGSIAVGRDFVPAIKKHMQIGQIPFSYDDIAATGSVNISSLGDYAKGNCVLHHNAMIFGVGLCTLDSENELPKEASVTYTGAYNVQPTDSRTRFVVGVGSKDDERKTGMRMDTFGDLMISGQYKTGGADYAEMFEWEDKNPENIDRVALAVTWGEGESIKLADSGDEIIGIVSATAAVLGDNPDEWDKRFITDQFGRKLMKEYTRINEDGEEETYEWFVENPEYDKDAPYISRSERPEWSAIGLVGKLYWIDDGTLEVGDYATVGSNGVATKGTKENGYRVMKRISKNVDGKSGVVKVFFK